MERRHITTALKASKGVSLPTGGNGSAQSGPRVEVSDLLERDSGQQPLSQRKRTVKLTGSCLGQSLRRELCTHAMILKIGDTNCF
jgi:hypothetical protein